MDLRQAELYEWQRRNFPTDSLLVLSKEGLVKIILILQMALGINEEAGEIAHHVLKGVQGIRGGKKGIDADQVVDGCGDTLIYMSQLLSLLKREAEEEFPKVISQVLSRDWIADPEGNGHGKPCQDRFEEVCGAATDMERVSLK